MLTLWLARMLLAFFAAAALLPLLRVGAWWVRVCDFPRLQLAAGTLVPVLLVLIGWEGANWYGERGLLLAVGLGLVAWQASHVIPYTWVVPHEVAAPDAQPDDAWIRLVVANLDYTNTRKREMLEALRSHAPDLLLLIEADEAWRDALLPLHDELPHECGEAHGSGLGLVLWSRWPLRECEVRRLISERRPSLHTLVQTPTGAVRLVCVHPTPPGLVDESGDDRHDSNVRDAELVVVANGVQELPDEPCIVTGDFNDVAWSSTTKLFKSLSGLRDPRVGRGLFNTYPAAYPYLRFPIDHVFVSPGFAIRVLRRIVLPGSDHFGVVAELAPPERPTPAPPPDAEEAERGEEIKREGRDDARDRGESAE